MSKSLPVRERDIRDSASDSRVPYRAVCRRVYRWVAHAPPRGASPGLRCGQGRRGNGPVSVGSYPAPSPRVSCSARSRPSTMLALGSS